MKKFIKWWKGRTLNEKLMYTLLLLFIIGIILRWDFIVSEVGSTIKNMYTIDTTAN